MKLRQLGKARMTIEDCLQVRDCVMKETYRPATRRKSGTDRAAIDAERVKAHGRRLVRQGFEPHPLVCFRRTLNVRLTVRPRPRHRRT